MKSPANNTLEELEKRGEMIQLGMAAASAAGLLTVLSLDDLDCPLWWASILFTVGIPTALGRALMTFTALLTGIYLNPVSWFMYPLGIISCLASAFGYIFIAFHISYAHGAVFCVFTAIALIWMYAHARKVKKIKEAA